MAKKDIDTYLKAKISEMSQQELIVFLYESAINLMEESKVTIGSGDIQGTHLRLNRARNIFLHLLGTLKPEGPGEAIAGKLSALYAYFIEKITVANTTKNAQEIDDILPIAGDLKNAWQDMKLDSESQNGTAEIPAVDQSLISVEV